MESRLLPNSKITLRLLCLLVALIWFNNMKYLNTRILKFLKVKSNSDRYILLWTNQFNVPFSDMGTGRSGFVSRKCEHTNCVVTADRNLLNDISMFDVIAFHGPDVFEMYYKDLPKKRSRHQKYVFASIESAHNYPVCSGKYNEYFNWTWTYKLDSEVRWGYFVVRDDKGAVIGPNKHMKWLKWSEMKDISDDFKKSLKTKTKAIAWFVSNCITKSRREGYVLGLQKLLLEYGVQIHVFGECGSRECPREKEKECYKMIEKDYYFYLAFENAFGEDYVTEKVLIALQNNAIPIVYGGADYSRFLPPGSYLDARELGLYKLANKIFTIMRNPEIYARYFKWKNHYSFHRTQDSPETDEYCQMCALLNNDEKMMQTSVYNKFRKWWDSSSSFCLR